MSQKELPIVRESHKDYERIEARIMRAFKALFYAPLLKELRELGIPFRLENARKPDDSLAGAIQKGLVTHARGVFRGKFSASVSKELKSLGAKWDRSERVWRLPLSELPTEVRAAISASEARFIAKLKALDARIAKILPAKIAESINVAEIFDTALWKMDKGISKSLDAITVLPRLTDEQRQKIAAEWAENMDLWIKDFTEEEITKLRQNVQKTIFAGNRHESLVSSIQRSYGVTAEKAKFLARQESRLLMAKFKETRYTAAGVKEYRWTCVHMPKDKNPAQHTPGNVRYSHGVLDGKVFRWDDPPITTPPNEPVRRNNPGQDYNCRCAARPIVGF